MRESVFLFLSLVIVLISSCVDDRDLTQNTVIAHITSQPDGLHPTNDNSANRTYVFNYTQRTLVKLDIDKLEIVPTLVKSLPTVSEDGLEYTYELVDGVKWDDGSPLEVDDVIHSTKVVLCPLTNNSQVRGNYTSVIKAVRKHPTDNRKFIMEAFDKHVSNKEIFAELYLQQKSRWDSKGALDELSFKDIHSKDFKATKGVASWFEKYNDSKNRYEAHRLVGLGPYQVTKWDDGSQITLTRKKNWWGDDSDYIDDQNNPDKIIFRVIADDAPVYMALKRQKLDVSTYIATQKLIQLKKIDYFNENYHSDFVNQYAYAYLGMNTKPDGLEHKPFFTDQKVRRAMAYLTPVDQVIKVVLKGKGEPQVANVSPLKKNVYNFDLKPIEFDIEKAKALLDEAGWKDTDGDNVRDKVVNGEKFQFEFKLNYMTGNKLTELGVLMIKEQMYKAGIKAVPNPMEFTLFYDNAQKHKFDMMWGAWGGSAGYSDPYQLWHTSSWANKGSNFCGFGDAESDSLIALANKSLDPVKHADATKALQAKIYKDQPYVFMYSYKRKIAIHKRFDNNKMYSEKPGVALGNLLLNAKYGGPNMKPTKPD
jgi:peptide/nickel transport system substrate-binding protein